MIQDRVWLLLVHLVLVLIQHITGNVRIRAEPPVQKDHFAVNINMPNVKPTEHDSYTCTTKRIDVDDAYIIHFEPSADALRAHHMLLFGCNSLYTPSYIYPEYWNCMHSTLCKKMTIMYAWAKNAPPITLPPDVGFHVGRNSSIHYVILQLHYANPLPEGVSDDSGITLHMTRKRQKYIAGIHLLLSGSAMIPPKSPKHHVDVNCYFRGRQPIHTFAYRVHAHKFGVVITGYKYSIKENAWTFLAKGNPQWPQTFYPMDQVYTISEGDVLAARCTYNSTQSNIPIYMGSTSNDEMCNLYIMYYTSADDGSSFARCLDVEIPKLVNELPADSDVPLPPNPELEENAHTSQWNQKPSISKKGNNVLIDDYYRPYPIQEIENFHSKKYHQGNDNYNSDFTYKEVASWPIENGKFGQIAAVDIDSNNNLVIFHRGDHVWNGLSFDVEDRYLLTEKGPISTPTIVTLDSETGHVLHQWGSNIFYMPHGLTLDGNYIWLTDVAMHQIFKYSLSGDIKPVLTLGERFVPGNDDKHFCKPTSVAISSNGDIYVADGYCNSRIVRLTSSGMFLNQWGQSNEIGISAPEPGFFAIPHKVTLIEDKGLVCVADRENGRIQCFTIVSGNFHFEIIHKEFGGRLFSIDYSPSKGGLLFAVCGPSIHYKHPVQAFVFNFTSRQLLNSFKPKQGTFTQPHDIAATRDGTEVFVSEIGPNKIWKFLKVTHKSTKKVLTDMPPLQTSSPLLSSQKATPEKSTLLLHTKSKYSGSKKKESEIDNFKTSMIIMALLAIPILLLIIITSVIRLKKRGKLQNCSLSHLKGWLGGYRTPHPQDKFNIGTLLNPHKGFDRVAMEESDIEEGSGSEVEEFNVVARKA
uniref:Peptidyl-glycine alpha-amidating monooxygenase A n=1 Tax=Tityus melici TaxID=3026321 RepID=A0AA49QCM8_9SCOR|nr:putative peptidyl-glycine alpha-amidating monooxygenase A [Tityus melici]